MEKRDVREGSRRVLMFLLFMLVFIFLLISECWSKSLCHVFQQCISSASVQAIFPYIFAVSKFLQPGTFDLVGTIVYEIDQLPYQNTFYNDTIEVTEAGGLVSVETVFFVSLGLALLVLLGLWVCTSASISIQVKVKTRRSEPKSQYFLYSSFSMVQSILTCCWSLWKSSNEAVF